MATALGLLALSGCSNLQKSGATDTENMLAAAGFRMKVATTQAQQAHLDALPKRKMVTHIQNDNVYYSWTDAEFCHCIYRGGPRAYGQYQKMLIQQSNAEMMENAEFAWGPWGPWGIY